MATHAENFVKSLSIYIVPVKKYLLSIGFSMIFFGLQASYSMEDNLSPSSPPMEGYVKVRIWNSNLGQGIAGHVSLQTCVSYISLWPNDEGNSITRYDSTLARKLGRGGEFVFNAPAIGMRFYEQDRVNEDDQDPDHIYLVQTNTNKIDEIAIRLLDIGEYEMTDDLFIMHEKYRWYAPGQNKSFSDRLENDKIYLNCASTVMLALYFGGIEEAYFNRVFNQKEAFAHLFKAFSNTNTSEENKENFIELSHLSHIILPSDIKTVLDSVLKDSFKEELVERIKKGRIVGIRSDDDISIKVILENIKLVDESKYITDILREKGWLYSMNNRAPFTFQLPSLVQNQIAHEKALREAGKAVVIASAVGVGAFMVSEVAKKNECVIF